ncbi:cytochrome P450 [Actinokineospora auranticolor]|uniref:Cytochrome P450 n=1 Tax=Actinokineospora auranticolor TaxID=155976 RepID=A0A2S6GF38_9PSEU|nr:cytochrome P450 [Actinokineospora auranticolor]PPK63837.1 cytochrome P450 [Actinokineospora auranticolor]
MSVPDAETSQPDSTTVDSPSGAQCPVRLDEQFFQDPYATYTALREAGRIQRVSLPQGTHAWMVTHYADVRTALAETHLSNDVGAGREAFERNRDPDKPPVKWDPALSSHMLNSDPPAHTRLRKLVVKAFTARGITHMRPRTEGIAAALLDDLAQRAADGDGTVDLIGDFAFPLPITVICELLGVPDTDREAFRDWGSTILSASPPDVIAEARSNMGQYMASLVAAKRAEPAEDLVTSLIEASEDGDRLNDRELVSMVFLLLLAGHETTVNLIASGMLALMQAPDQLAKLAADPSLMPRAIEEFLRLESPVNVPTVRHTTAPIELAGVTIEAGDLVLAPLCAANRDPGKFPDPDQLDVTRDTAGHIAFGHGVHYCVGAPLARMEGEVALRALLTRFPDITLAVDPSDLRWAHSTTIRGLKSLPVRLS